jgi:hypothetical protein
VRIGRGLEGGISKKGEGEGVIEKYLSKINNKINNQLK